MPKYRRTYDAEFKRNALALIDEQGQSVAETAQHLGIKSHLLYRWWQELHDLGDIAFSGQGNHALTAQEKKIKDLEKKLKNAELERDILKKALAIFSKTQK